MQFLSYSDVPTDQISKTFKNASWRSLFWVVVIMGVVTAYTAIPKGEPTNPVLIAVPGMATLFFTLLFLWHLHKSRNPRCWLLKAAGDDLYVNLQSNVNVPPATAETEVLRLPAGSVAAIQRVHELRILPARNGHYKNHFTYFDFRLHEPIPEDLLLTLARIRRNPAIRGSAGLTRDIYTAVRVRDQYTLRLVWDWMTPRELAAEAWFAARFPVEEKAKERGPGWDTLDKAARDRYIATLWEWGDVQDAILQKSMLETISERNAAMQLAEELG
jgi:hypothetical protein